MQLFTVQELLNKYKSMRGQYVNVQGYYSDHTLRHDNSESPSIILVDKDTHFHSSLDYFLKKMNRSDYKGTVRLIGKIGVAMTSMANIGQILKVEILDESNKIVDHLMLDSNSMPKELRGKI